MGYATNNATILASAARTALVAATDLQVPEGTDYLEIVIAVTAQTATPAVTFTVKGATGETILASAALGSTAVTCLRLGPGIVAISNLAAQCIPHPGMTIEAAVGDTDSCTYSVVRRAK